VFLLKELVLKDEEQRGEKTQQLPHLSGRLIAVKRVGDLDRL